MGSTKRSYDTFNNASNHGSDFTADGERIKKTEPMPDALCPCRGGETESMIQCDGCSTWYHYSCVALQPSDPPEIKNFYCAGCHRVGVGQTTWYKGSAFSKQQNKRVNEELLQRADRDAISEAPVAVPAFRLEQQREFYVKRSPTGLSPTGLATVNNAPLVINPPHDMAPPEHVSRGELKEMNSGRVPQFFLPQERELSRGFPIRTAPVVKAFSAPSIAPSTSTNASVPTTATMAPSNTQLLSNQLIPTLPEPPALKAPPARAPPQTKSTVSKSQATTNNQHLKGAFALHYHDKKFSITLIVKLKMGPRARYDAVRGVVRSSTEQIDQNDMEG